MSSLASVLFVVLALLAPSCALPSQEGGRCGDYCSYEHVGEYFGPLDTTKDLQQALDQLSFKREIILSHHGQLDQAYQVPLRATVLGCPSSCPTGRSQRALSACHLASQDNTGRGSLGAYYGD